MLNIFDNLHGSIKKGQLQKCLDVLVEEKQLICKEYNTKIYLASQHHYPAINEEEMNKFDSDISESREAISKIKEETNKLQSELKQIQQTYSNEELDEHIKSEQKAIKELENKIAKIEDKNSEKIPEEKMKVAEDAYEKEKNFYKKAKKIAMDIIDQLADGMELKSTALMVNNPM
jgi:26S proteasome regulatory subunit, ATPase 3, interacting protein